jgi:hypothetical protein
MPRPGRSRYAYCDRHARAATSVPSSHFDADAHPYAASTDAGVSSLLDTAAASGSLAGVSPLPLGSAAAAATSWAAAGGAGSGAGMAAGTGAGAGSGSPADAATGRLAELVYDGGGGRAVWEAIPPCACGCWSVVAGGRGSDANGRARLPPFLRAARSACTPVIHAAVSSVSTCALNASNAVTGRPPARFTCRQSVGQLH